MNGVGPHVDPITVGETGVEGDLPGAHGSVGGHRFGRRVLERLARLER
jgi:hypothetical protein